MFNERDTYLNELQPIIMKLKEICSLKKIPMFLALAIADDGKHTEYEYETIMATTEKRLADNHIASALLAINEFDLDYPKNVKEAMMVLEHYLERTENLQETGEPLSEDYLSDFNEIRHGAKAVMPKEFLHGAVLNDEEDYEEYEN